MLDIKSTKYKTLSRLHEIIRSKIGFTVLVYIIMLSLAVFTMYSYYGVELNLSKVKYKNPFDSFEYSNSLFESNYYLNFRASQNENNKIERPSEFYLPDSTIDKLVDNVDVDYYAAKLGEEDIRSSFDKSFKSVGEYILRTEGYQKYLTLNTKSGYKISNYNFDMANVERILKYKDVKDPKGEEERKKVYKEIGLDLDNKYRNYVVIEYDSKGNCRVLYVNGIGDSVFRNNFLQLESNKKIDEIYTLDPEHYERFSNYKLEPIKDRLFVYAVPKNVDISFYDQSNSLARVMYATEKNVFRDFLDIQNRICLAIIIITLVVPTRQLRKYWGLSTGARLPFFVILTVGVIIYFSFIDNVPKVYMIRETLNGSILKGIMRNNLDPTWYRGVVNFINILFWFYSYTFVFCYVVLFKRFIEYGPKKYIEERSILYYIGSNYIVRLKRFVDNLISIDMSKKYNRLWIIGIVIVFLGTVVLSLTKFTELIPWALSILVFLILMLNYIRLVSKQVKDVAEDYSKLLELTKTIAEGDLDRDIESEDIGVYDEIKNQLVSIKKAYKKSVDEEIKSQQMKSELISNVSHDLKTPVTSIITYSDLLMNIDTSDEARKYIETIYRKSERLKILIDDMFEISNAQTGNIKMDINQINVVELMKQAISELEDIISKKGLILISKYPDLKIILDLDGEKTYRVFENLLVNMSKYAMPNTRAYIEIQEKDDDVVISFKNISETYIYFGEEEILERFIRGDKSRNTEGSGLGLSIAKSYVELQGGTMQVILDGDLFKVVITFKKQIKK